MSSAKALKRQLRQSMAARLAHIPQHRLALQSSNVEKILRELPIVKQAKKVGVYMNMDSAELKTLGIISALFDMGKSVYLPHCIDLGEGDFKRFEKQKACLAFYKMPSMKSVLNLTPQGKYKLKEPTSGINVMDEKQGLDLLLLPAVAYTKNCYRMGHGVGFYDDFIKRHSEKHGARPFLLGTGLKEQLVSELPVEPHDEKLDLVVLNDMVYVP